MGICWAQADTPSALRWCFLQAQLVFGKFWRASMTSFADFERKGLLANSLMAGGHKPCETHYESLHLPQRQRFCTPFPTLQCTASTLELCSTRGDR